MPNYAEIRNALDDLAVERRRLLRDQEVIDKIAVMLGTRPSWSGADMLEAIANLIGCVRPHPGDKADTYVQDFESATGRGAPAGFIWDDETIGA